jgi:hypothetical protein
MIEWNKKEEEHVGALEEAQEFLQWLVVEGRKGLLYLPATTLSQAIQKAETILKKWSKK